MEFILYCVDKPGHEDVRKANRDDHLAFIRAAGTQVKFGGPMLTADGAGMAGSMLVVEADSIDAARAFAAGDPYGKAGLFESVVIRPFKTVIDNR